MKQTYLICFLLITMGLVQTHTLQAQSAVFQIKLKEINGYYRTIGDLKGSQLTIVDFWATWCKPCVKSIPKLVELSHTYDNETVAFVGVNVDSPRNTSKVRPFAMSRRIDYPVLLDSDQALYGELLVSVLPTLFILDKEGKVLYTHEGYTTGDEKIFKEKIDQFLSDAK
ncbi:TlpA family protein disulfide reductase [Reichenbachiella agarivorans]|uniref:TlpA family protein disulfide reductase n=1 Tax=Reichenbachiella agarivorans TaxID=2979464 RepID=A0ABY6CME6_9BACT|nr:TlpA disulfide reductase family protein [Reichenbachiella agarivorans]UXP31549.1 TlpA family protein disulfide reductase [Reichenbachiella agarivorans]